MNKEQLVQYLESNDEILVIGKDDMEIEIHEGNYYVGGSDWNWVTSDNVGFSIAEMAVDYALQQIGGIENLKSFGGC